MINIEDLPSFIIIQALELEAQPSTFLKMSSLAANLLGWRDPEEAYGKSDYDIPAIMARCAPRFIYCDRLSLKSNKRLVTLEFLNFASGWKMMLVEKNLHFSTHIILQSTEITKTPLFNVAYTLLKSNVPHWDKSKDDASYILGENYPELSLSQRQTECLFYLVRGKTAKHILRILGIDYRTVETHIFHIKNKLGCNTKEQLIEKAFESGIAYFVPKSLIMSQNNYII